MSIQQDVLDTIGPEGVEKDRLREKVGNIGQDELDCAVNALQRAGRVRMVFGRYEIIESRRPLGDMRGGPGIPKTRENTAEAPPSTSTYTSNPPPDLVAELSQSAQRQFLNPLPVAPPSAIEEAAASLQPTAEKTAYCAGCQAHHPESAFKRGSSGKLYNQCREYRSNNARRQNGKRHAESTAEPAPERAFLPAIHADIAPLVRQRLSEVFEQIEIKQEELKALETKRAELERYLDLDEHRAEFALYLELHQRLSAEVS